MWFAPLGDSAVTLTLGKRADARVLASVGELAARLRDANLPGVTDVVPAFATVSVFYDPLAWSGGGAGPYDQICAAISTMVQTWRKEASPGSHGDRPHDSAEKVEGRRREIPVCYGGEFGPDLAEVAAHARMTEAEVIAQHTAAEYRVQAIGFAPGFPYLAGLPEALATPRRATPRAEVAAGSVGIGGAQTGVYPVKSPGGWQLIGRTPLKLFDAARAEPAWLRVGDVVTFRAITVEELAAWK